MDSEEQGCSQYLASVIEILNKDVKTYRQYEAANIPEAVKAYRFEHIRGEVDALALLGFRVLWDDDGYISAIEIPDMVRELIANG